MPIVAYIDMAGEGAIVVALLEEPHLTVVVHLLHNESVLDLALVLTAAKSCTIAHLNVDIL
jgi:hypothetical protein